MLYVQFPDNQLTLSKVADVLIKKYCFNYFGMFCLIYCRGCMDREKLKHVYMCNDKDIDKMISAGYIKEIN